MSILIKNGTVIDGREIRADVFVDNGRIMRVGDLGDVAADTVIDATGCYVMPGLVEFPGGSGRG